MPEDLVRELLQESEQRRERLGLPANPDDYLWIGGKEQIDIYEYLDKEFPPYSGLETILAAIIGFHPDNSARKTTKPPKSLDQVRLAKAMQALVLKKAPRGHPAEDVSLLLREVAREYYLCSLGFGDKKATFAGIVRKLKLDLDTWGEERRRKFIAKLRKQFEAQKHALLVEVSGGDLPEKADRRHRVETVIRILGQLGYAGPPR
jgi:hypothetical protein